MLASRSDGAMTDANEILPLAIAVHEVGHAVAHLLINAAVPKPETRVRELTLDPSDGNLGLTRIHLLRKTLPHYHAVRCLGGYAAELALDFGRDWPAAEAARLAREAVEGRHDNVVDFSAALAALCRLPGANLEGEFFRCWLAAVAVARADWQALLAVARELVAARAMDGAKFEASWHAAHGADDAALLEKLRRLGERSRKLMA